MRIRVAGDGELWRGALRGLLAAIVMAGACLAQEGSLEERVLERTLDNGWRFLLLPRTDAPVVSFETYVAVGSAQDPEGMAGLAHQIQNMLFKGSDRVGTRDWSAEEPALESLDQSFQELHKARASEDPQLIAAAEARFEAARNSAAAFVVSDEYGRLLEEAGGGPTLNAYTTADETRFVVSLPSNQIELWCWMESERFSRPVFREFYVERDALLADRRSRVENDPAGRLAEALLLTAYGDHPLARPTIGSEDEIRSFTRPAALKFFHRYYVPANMRTAIVGDFDPAEMLSLIERYFGGLPTRRAPAYPALAAIEQEAQRSVMVPFDAQPRLMLAFHAPAITHPDAAAVEVAVRLLGYARSSRLERRLLREEALASEVAVSPAWRGDRNASLAMIRAVPIQGVSLARLEAAILEEIASLASTGPDAEELAGVKRVASADHLRSLRDNGAIAAGLAAYDAKAGGWLHFFQTAKRLQAVSSEDVQRVLGTWFSASHRTLATLQPTEEDR